MSVSVSSPAQLHMNTHLWEHVPVVCKQSGSPGMPWQSIPLPTVPGWLQEVSAACAMHHCGQQARGTA